MSKPVQKPLVFISHISEEREIAASLKALLETSFVGMMEVFVSSDPKSIRLGQQWLEQISIALKRCVIEIIIASPVSVRRPWVNFEAGAAWVRELPLIPICHSGMTFAKLPSPLNTLQSALGTKQEELELIVPQIAKALGSSEPKIDFSPFVSVVKNYEETTAQSVELSQDVLIPGADGLTAHERVTLEEIADLIDSPDDGASYYALKESVARRGFRKMATLLATKLLERKGLIEVFTQDDYGGNPVTVAGITDEGWLWLEKNGNLLTDPPAGGYGPSENSRRDDEVPF